MAKSRRSRKADETPGTDLMLAEKARQSVLYLPDGDDAVVIERAVVPPDLTQCQCEWPDPAAHTFGPQPRVRCQTEPTVVAFQKRQIDNAAPTGAISLCDDHRVLLEHMHPGQVYYRLITPERTIGAIL